MPEGKFVTAINCMDGRVQEPVMQFFKLRHGADFVDTISEPGPIKALSEGDTTLTGTIKTRVEISVEKHGSKLIAVIGHDDCAGNPVAKDEQLAQIDLAIEVVKSWGFNAKVIGLFVKDNYNVEVVRE
ncbi:MAG: hypothetical protein NTY09_01540 [bacterium]|nr:hypothetical protein [bacterium]